MQLSGWQASLGLLHTVTLSDVGKTVKVDSSENITCFTLSTAQDFRCWHHWNRCLALARVTKVARPCISTLWSSWRTVLVETGELRCTFNSAVSWAAVVLCFFGYNTGKHPDIPFRWIPLASSRQLLLLDVVHPSRWYADITLDTVAFDTSQRLAVRVRVKGWGEDRRMGFLLIKNKQN